MSNNALRVWFSSSRTSGPKTRKELAGLLGISASYLSQLCSDSPPWPSRAVGQKLEDVTEGKVTVADFMYMPKPSRVPGGRKDRPMSAKRKYHEMIAAGRDAVKNSGRTVTQDFGEVTLRSYVSGSHHWFHRDGGRDITNSLRTNAVLALIEKELDK